MAQQSVVAIAMINEALERAYGAAGIPVADVEAAFHIDDWDTLVPMAGYGEVPLNLALLCERSWMCHPPPLGPDRHPNVLGFTGHGRGVRDRAGPRPGRVWTWAPG